MSTHRSMGAAIFLAFGVVGGCARYFAPPVQPKPELLGCWRLETNLPSSYADSLGYRVPELIQLGYSEGGQWTVLPTDEEWKPRWTIYDEMVSGIERRTYGAAATRPIQWDSVRTIPGDSIDVLFPSAIGTLGIRLGQTGSGLSGRAEWNVDMTQLHLNEGIYVRARPAKCEGLLMALERTRYK